MQKSKTSGPQNCWRVSWHVNTKENTNVMIERVNESDTGWNTFMNLLKHYRLYKVGLKMARERLPGRTLSSV